MVKIYDVKFLAWSLTAPIFEVTVECDQGHKRTYTPTASQLRAIASDYNIHRDAQNNIEWVEGTTNLLTCPVDRQQVSFYIAVHRSGMVAIYENTNVMPASWHKLKDEDDLDAGDYNLLYYHAVTFDNDEVGIDIRCPNCGVLHQLRREVRQLFAMKAINFNRAFTWKCWNCEKTLTLYVGVYKDEDMDKGLQISVDPIPNDWAIMGKVI